MDSLFRPALILSVVFSGVAVAQMLGALRWIRSKTQWYALFFPSGAFFIMSITVLADFWNAGTLGSHEWLLSGITMALSAGAVAGVTSLIGLMREQQERDEEVDFLRQRYERLFKQNDLPILVSEAETLSIVDANAAAAEVFEIPVEEMLRRTVLDLGIEDAPDETAVSANVRDRTAAGLVLRTPSGAHREISIHRSVAATGATHLHYDIVEDVTERNAARRALVSQKELMAHLADHDPLTTLPNRRVLEPALARVAARARRGSTGALLFIDVDDFKLVNDEEGHQAGDAALVSIAEMLSEAVRAGDVVARIGGDEFAILLEADDVAGATAIATRLTESIRELFPKLGLSIGIVSVADAADSLDAIRRADRAMYAAKNSGKNCVIVDGDAQESAPPSDVTV